MLYAHLVSRCRGLAAQVYGQGISVAAIEAETLQRLLQVASTTIWHKKQATSSSLAVYWAQYSPHLCMKALSICQECNADQGTLKSAKQNAACHLDIVWLLSSQEKAKETRASKVTAADLASVAAPFQAMAKDIVDFPFSVSTGMHSHAFPAQRPSFCTKPWSRNATCQLLHAEVTHGVAWQILPYPCLCNSMCLAQILGPGQWMGGMLH